MSSMADTKRSINLRDHQKTVVDYLNKHQKNNGLILYHAMGAGKTITSLAYAKQQKLDTVILVPEILKAHWLSEKKKTSSKR